MGESFARIFATILLGVLFWCIGLALLRLSMDKLRRRTPTPVELRMPTFVSVIVTVSLAAIMWELSVWQWTASVIITAWAQ